MILKIGDKVEYRGNWGKDAPVETEVIAITIGFENSALHHGFDVEAILMESLQGRKVIVSLKNGKWGYGFQIKKVEEK